MTSRFRGLTHRSIPSGWPTSRSWLNGIGFTCVTLASSLSYAAYSNYNSVLIGERAAGLGGAFTALSDDAAATAFYNPATTVLMDGSSLSASVNVYNKFETHLGESADFSQAPQRLNRGFFRSLPSSSATILHFRSFAFGLSILVPDYEFYSGQLKGVGDTNSLLNIIDESLWVGGTFSGRLTMKDSVGLSLYYTARNLTRTATDRTITGGGTGEVITNEDKNLTANSVVAIFGYHRQLNPYWKFGVSYRPPSLPIAGDAAYFRSTVETTPYTSTVINRGDLRALTKIPAKASFGIAREVKGRSTLSFDLSFYEGQSYFDLPELPDGSEEIIHRHVVNFAFGFEQQLKEWLKLRLGVFSNKSSHPDPQLSTGKRQGDHVDMNGFSMNFNVQTGRGTSFTLGGYYSGGRGETTQIVGQQLTLVPKSQQVFTMLVATGFVF